ncbi:MAG TPA: cytochrome c oxidase assembly protein [Acidobacteriaceae bacterium]|jgi:cytochrome c oxidase assembly factor CtaG|nr:cytochrome c oxidase assembly protein [Acidobacteriaceae bacterium]
MNADALVTRWDIPWAVTTALAITALVYVRGWREIRRTRPERFPVWRLATFLGGILALFVAVSSPLDTFSESLLFMHMGQHFVLMSIAPPLIAFGAPLVPMLRGLPRPLIRSVLRPLFQTGFLPKIGAFLTRPKVAWLAFAISYVGWHIPRAYEFALSSENIHNCEHACFFFTSLLFWWPVIEPWPLRSPWKRTGSGENGRWLLLPYLLLADVVNTALSASLCFSGKLLYPSYAAQPRLLGLSAMNDQIAAGAFMWVMGSMMYLIPAMIITLHLLSPRRQFGQRARYRVDPTASRL